MPMIRYPTNEFDFFSGMNNASTRPISKVLIGVYS